MMGPILMSGQYSGVQTRILEIKETALYMHCCSHVLNLIINDAVSGKKKLVTSLRF